MASGPQILVAVTADGKQAVAEFKSVGDAAKYLEEQANANKSAFERMHEGLTKASGKLRDFGKSAFDAGKQMTVGLTLPIVAFGKQAVESYMEAEKAQARLQDTFSRFKNVADVNINTVNQLADATLRKTRFDDEGVRVGFSTLAQYGLTGKQITALVPLMTDYAAKTGKDLPAAAEVLGKALLGKGKALAEVGIKFKDTKTLAGNYGEIMDGLGAKVRGFAEKDAKTAEGRLEQLKNQFGELKEGIGTQLMPVLMALGNKLLGLLDGFNSLSPGMQKIVTIVGVAVAAAGPLVMVFGALATAVSFLISPVGLVVVAIAALAAGFVYAYTHSEAFRAKVDTVVQWLKAEVPVAFEWVKTKVAEAIEAISRFWARWGDDIIKVAVATFNYLKNLVQASFDTIKGIWEVFSGLFSGDWGKVWNGLKDIVKGVWEQITAGIRAFGPLLLDAAKWAFDKILDAFVASWAATYRWVSSLPGKIVNAMSSLSGLLVDLGESAMHGLWEGIKSGASKFLLGGNIQSKVKEIHAAAKAAQRTNSPSLLYMELGESAMEGYAAGIVSGRDRATTAVVGAINDTYSRAGEAARNGSAPLIGALVGSMAGEGARAAVTSVAGAIFGSMAGEAARNGGAQVADALFTSMAGEAARNGNKPAKALFAAMAGEAARNGATVYVPLAGAMAGEAARNGREVAKPLFAAMAGEAARNGAQQIARSLRDVLVDQAKSLGYDMGAAMSEEITGSLEDVIDKMSKKVGLNFGGSSSGTSGGGMAAGGGGGGTPVSIGDLYGGFTGTYGEWARNQLGELANWNQNYNTGGAPQVRVFAPNPFTGGTLTDASGNGVYLDDLNGVRDALSRLAPQMASGGIVSAPTLAMIGEAGPEAVVPLSRGGAGLGGTVTVNVAGSVITERDLVDQIRKSLIVAQQRGLTLVP